MTEGNTSQGPAYVDGNPYGQLGSPSQTHEREIDARGPEYLRGGRDRNGNASIVRPRWKAEDQDYEEVRRDFPSPTLINPLPARPQRAEQTPPPVEHRRTSTRSREVDEVVWDVSRTKDVTIHLELDIAEDLEKNLDEFCRLARLGDFQGAKQYFQENLEQHMDDPYIFVHLEHSEHLLLQTNWELIKVLTASHTECLSEEDEQLAAKKSTTANTIQEAKAKFEQLEAKKNEDTLKSNAADDFSSRLGSTECQILSLALRIEARLHQDEPSIERSILTTVYEELLRQGRIWDFRDIFIGAVHSYGSTRAFEEFFGTSEIPLDRILRAWSTTIYDESTNLALLDILTSVALRRILSPRTFPDTKHLVDEAGVLASNIVHCYPNNLKSRQYLRWILAKLAITSYQNMRSSSELSQLPGLFISKVRVVELPIYVPAALETPDWHLLHRPSKSCENLETTLKAARQLGDLETEALCLFQSILHSEEPAELFEDLISLQKRQNDIRSLLTTYLSKYLICRDKESRDALREELLSIRDDINLHPNLMWAKKMILRALSQSKHEAELLLDEIREFPHKYPSLSRNIREFMKRNKLEKETEILHNSDQNSDYLLKAPGLEQYFKRMERKKEERERERMRYEEEGLYSKTWGRGDTEIDYSPSPPHASGGSYYPPNNLPPPPASSNSFVTEPVEVKRVPATGDHGSDQKHARLKTADKVPSETEKLVGSTLLEDTVPEIPKFRRPPLVSVSSMKEEED
ncbi:hypothetical protein N431DRAFT_472087 [Stipitochalara longipes BDJ]|nr:hypothetical protein N431DRAFT_472087 [Stipitochalara longipes BDJ]